MRKLILCFFLFSTVACQKSEFYEKSNSLAQPEPFPILLPDPNGNDKNNPILVADDPKKDDEDPKEKDPIVDDPAEEDPKDDDTDPIEVVHSDDPRVDCSNLNSNVDHQVEIGFAIDDAGTLFVDSQEVKETSNWRVQNTVNLTLKGGCHLLAFKGEDTHHVISGLIAYMKVDGNLVWVSGDNNEFLKVYGPESPVGNWTSFEYDDSSWSSVQTCNNNLPWGLTHHSMYALGSKWIWWSANCNSLAKAYFRLNFVINDQGSENVIHSLPMQGGNHETPCPTAGIEISRANLANDPFYKKFDISTHFDSRCVSKFGAGYATSSIKTISCSPDPRGVGFGPNNSADIKCSK